MAKRGSSAARRFGGGGGSGDVGGPLDSAPESGRGSEALAEADAGPEEMVSGAPSEGGWSDAGGSVVEVVKTSFEGLLSAMIED